MRPACPFSSLSASPAALIRSQFNCLQHLQHLPQLTGRLTVAVAAPTACRCLAALCTATSISPRSWAARWCSPSSTPLRRQPPAPMSRCVCGDGAGVASPLQPHRQAAPPTASPPTLPLSQVVYYLSGLTCNDENFIQKAGAQRKAAELGLALVAPDTSPRGLGIEGEDDR